MVFFAFLRQFQNQNNENGPMEVIQLMSMKCALVNQNSRPV